MPQSGESSVEEILESIKKVIARDNRAMAAEARVRRERAADAQDAPEPVAQEEADEVLDLDDAMVEEELVESGDVEPDGFEADETGDHALDPEYASDTDADSLLTDAASDAMRDNLAALAMMATPPAAPQIVRTGETSLEGLVREMLRPMLAEWLDANLPGMVEKMVQAEISRIAGKKG